MSGTPDQESERDKQLAFTVATVWRQARVSCPHPDLLQSYLQGGMDAGAKEFVDFHLRESQCPYCNSIVEDLRSRENDAKAAPLHDLRDKLMRSTAAALRTRRS